MACAVRVARALRDLPVIRGRGRTPLTIDEGIARAALEGIKLPAKIAAPGQRDDTHRPSGARLIDELNTRTCL